MNNLETIKKSFKKGKIFADDFIESIMFTTPRRTHLLSKGDYVIISCPYLDSSNLYIEKISRLDYPEIGDFSTIKGTTGPISGNVFIKIDKRNCPEYMLIEGDCVRPGNGSVYDFLRKYLENKELLNKILR